MKSQELDQKYGLIDAGADPGAGKGRGTNRPSCRWLGEPDSLVIVCSR